MLSTRLTLKKPTIIYQLEASGILSITINLIMHCVSSSSLSLLLWNGEKLPSFLPSRGYLLTFLAYGWKSFLWLSIRKCLLLGFLFQWLLTIQLSLIFFFFLDDFPIFMKAKSFQARLFSSILDSFAKTRF